MENESFKIFGTEWKIMYVDSITVEGEDTFKFGLSDSINKVISIATKKPNGGDFSRKEIELTTMHEIIHAICDEGMYKDYSSDKPFAEWMARCLLDIKEQKNRYKGGLILGERVTHTVRPIGFAFRMKKKEIPHSRPHTRYRKGYVRLCCAVFRQIQTMVAL